MGYEEALQAAGAEVLEFEQFGSCQGDWWAKVRYKDELGWVQGSYGSCSGCDAFEGEFGGGRKIIVASTPTSTMTTARRAKRRRRNTPRNWPTSGAATSMGC